ncbi:MAG: transketolase C-terminal domain-containing protein [Candidatus Gracilibacteria bacterium]|jgi:2-oxoglutarate ferredoxin oxidoreductase subunit alpha|nr:transketolase C-terminal domain-containing protein [Candidatus Gracilibacteria bacterium]
MRIALKITGSGGVLSSGVIFLKILNKMGLFVKAEREFPSLIKGGVHNFLIDFSDEEIFSNSKNHDVLCDFENSTIYAFKEKLLIPNDLGKLKNTVFIGALCAIFNFEKNICKKVVSEYFKKFKEENLSAFEIGFAKINSEKYTLKIRGDQVFKKQKIVNGNEAIAIGAFRSGLSHYFAYPMSPATSVINYLPDSVSKMISADEISAVSMCLGAMYSGKNALTATSSGGFDLMTETISASGIMEIPLVVVLAQRPGPGTGLPTWDSQDNINLAVYGGHGDFPKSVLSISDANSAISIMPKAFMLAKKHRIPVIVLTQKSIAESYYSTIPESKKEIFKFLKYEKLINADEHDLEGNSIEGGELARKSMIKRMSKMKEVIKDMPKNVIFGPKKAEISFVATGSVIGAVRDSISVLKENGVSANLLEITSIWPLEKNIIKEFFSNNKKVIMVEQNYTGQLGGLIEKECEVKFFDCLHKFDGISFSYEDIIKFYNESVSRKK